MATVLPSQRDFEMSNGGNASALLLLLDENDMTICATALKSLATIVDDYWPEVADSILKIEALAEDHTFPEHQLAAYIASKCFFHLEEYSDALRLAFSAGEHFQVSSPSPYVETLIATCIDEYVSLRKRKIDEKENDVAIDTRMEEIVNRMFERCYATQSYMQALGLALESRRIEKMEEILNNAPLNEKSALLHYAFNTCRKAVKHYATRLQAIEIIYKIFEKLPHPDYSCICHCLQLLNRPEETTKILERLVLSSNEDDVLLAYQISVDLAENENQKFLLSVHNGLPKKWSVSNDATADSSSEMKDDYSVITDDKWKCLDNVKTILNGEFLTDLWLDFLFHSSKSDRVLMKRIQEAVENRNSVLHNAAVVTHAYLNCGTAIDAFLRGNLEWMGRATNWAKFTATASIGVIHKGHTKESMNLLQPYLPQTDAMNVSKYSEGGALYALGLIHANKSNNETVANFILAALRNTGADEVVVHGGCLGIGLIGLKTYRSDIYELLLQILMSDNAVSGEAAAFAIGLVMLGSGCTSTNVGSRTVDDIIRELLSYAHETKHEKIIRALSIGLAFIMYGKESDADGLIEQMVRDKDPIIRYGGVYAIGQAYCGTSNNDACRRLLHIAVSDVNDDVRRAAVLNIGFILIRTPEQVPKLVSLLSESYNANVRYGACLAVGIACAGTGKNEAVQLLEPMLEDPIDYVRQGSFIALAMVLMQSNDTNASRLRDKVTKAINDKHANIMTKMGAILAQGILDAGGRNVIISCLSHTGLIKMSSIVGIVLWSHYWYWYPCMLALELAFQPTAMIGLNKDLKIPKEFYVKCNAKKSEFAYPEPLQDKKEEKKERVATAVLSVTGKARTKKHDKKDVEVGEKPESKEVVSITTKTGEKTEASEKNESSIESKAKEPIGFQVKNMERTLIKQEKYLAFDPNQRYVPVSLPRRASGVIILKDKTPELPENVESVKLPIGGSTDPENEALPPEPFEWKVTDVVEDKIEETKEKSKDEKKGNDKSEDVKSEMDMKE